MKQFKVREELLPFVEAICKRRRIKYSVITDLEGEKYILTNISGTQFHKIIVRASCEKSCKDLGNTDILYLAKSEAKDPAEVERLMQEANVSGYCLFH